ncbi:hypothetical protein Tco_1339839, partial [Tanacetum coccineum]
ASLEDKMTIKMNKMLNEMKALVVTTPAPVSKQLRKYGYIKNHKKTIKNGQARTRESEEYKKKPKIQSQSQKSQASVKSSQNGQTLVNKSQPIKGKSQKHSIFTLQVSQKSKNIPSPLIGP